MVDLAASTGCGCPTRCCDPAPQRLRGDGRAGLVPVPAAVRPRADGHPHARRTSAGSLREVAEDEAADGSGWLEIQVDPSGYAARFDGLTAFVELVLDAAG